MKLKDLKKLADANEIPYEKNVSFLSLKKKLTEAGIPIDTKDTDDEYETIEGVVVKKNLSESVKAAIVAAELARRAKEESAKIEKELAEQAEHLSYEQRAEKAAMAVFKNPDLLSYLEDEDPIKKQAVRNRATRKIRVSIVVVDPAKQQIGGAIIKSRNALSGVVSEYVHYSPDPQHLCAITVKTLKEKTFNKFVDDYRINGEGVRVKTGTKTVKQAPAFIINELPHLTKEELEELKDLQAKQAIQTG